jgi:hypothetical protein
MLMMTRQAHATAAQRSTVNMFTSVNDLSHLQCETESVVHYSDAHSTTVTLTVGNYSGPVLFI